jgi:NAD(P)-dependent dehydrogenase (short-subunit alcohol dehydrogenase family)
MKSLQDCGVAVFGGTAGSGLATAIAFARHGSRVVILGRNPERGESARAACLEAVPGAEVRFVAADTSVAGETVRAVDEAVARLGSLEVAVCATSPSRPPRLLHEVPIEELRFRIDEVALPQIHPVRAVLPGMRAQGGGSIVVVASDAARVPTPGESAIGAGMAAIIMFCKTAAVEAKRDGIRINVITPSLITGTLGEQMVYSEPFSAKLFEKAKAAAHLGVAEPTDIAELAVFLAGPGARRITGQVISPNGGISIA